MLTPEINFKWWALQVACLLMESTAHPGAKLKVLFYTASLFCTLTGAVNQQSRSSINQLPLARVSQDPPPHSYISYTEPGQHFCSGRGIYAQPKAKNMQVLSVEPAADLASFKHRINLLLHIHFLFQGNVCSSNCSPTRKRPNMCCLCVIYTVTVWIFESIRICLCARCLKTMCHSWCLQTT